LKVALIALLLIAFCFGVWRGNTTVFEHSVVGNLIGKKVTLTGVISDDPATNERNFLAFKVSHLQYEGKPVNGSVQVQTSFKKLQRGYTVQVTGKLAPNLGITRARTAYGQVVVISEKVTWLEMSRQRFFAALRSAMPDSVAGFALGLLIGTRALIPKDLQSSLAIVGLTHLIAVSGYNLTIIVRAAHKLFGRISTFLATAVSLWLIAAFLLVAGFGASIVRAALVSVLSLVTIYYGHRIKPVVLVAIPAALTAAYNPDYLTRDLGWQLSFLAFIGIVIIAPIIEQRFVRRPNPLISLLIESSTAQLMTFPLILLVFGQVSIISPIANLIILPLVPLGMLLAFASGICAMMAPVVGSWVALPAIGLLALMVGVVQWLAALPAASIQISATALQVATIYVSILILAVALRRGGKYQKEINKTRLSERLLA
jgi:competence protein ComEC